MEGGNRLVFINLDYFFGKFYDFLIWIRDGLFDGSLGKILLFILGLISVGLLFVIFYSSIRMKEIEQEEDKKKAAKFAAKAEAPKVPPRHDKWQLVQNHMFSNNAAEWRLAIIEADTILEELTIELSLPGISLGERLKFAQQQGSYKTVQAAWEAHLVRNRIAHQGSGYELTQAEANRVIRLYEDVFREFNYI